MAFSVFTSHHDTLSNSDKHLSELPGDIGDRSTYAERLSQEKLLTQKLWRDTSSVQRAERPLLDISHPLACSKANKLTSAGIMDTIAALPTMGHVPQQCLPMMQRPMPSYKAGIVQLGGYSLEDESKIFGVEATDRVSSSVAPQHVTEHCNQRHA